MSNGGTRANSAGIVLYRIDQGVPEILLVHPGGPFWAKKDTNGWSIPKGEFDPAEEDSFEAACREFAEETGHPVPTSDAVQLKPFKAGKKTIHGWLMEGDLDPTTISSNTFEIEWPPRSGRTATFPEVDRAAWFDLDQAATKLHKGQIPICELIAKALKLQS